jgi:GntR family transcriptional regulator, rspAB operon transcriptional repressor
MGEPVGDAGGYSFGDEAANGTDASRAYQAIRHRILRCRFAPGSVINERTLMEEISIGRTPIREALLRLSAEGLVVYSAQSIHVAPISVDSVSALYTARLNAERLAWRLWIRAATPERIDTLASAFDPAAVLAKKGDDEGFVELDFRFHNQVYKECGNPFLTKHLYNLNGLSFRVWFLSHPHQIKQHLQTVRSHDPIIKAVKQRNAAAIDRAVTEHICSAYDSVIERLKGDGVSVASSLGVRELT